MESPVLYMAAIQQHTAVFLLYAVWKSCCIAVFLPAHPDTHFLLYAAVCCMPIQHTAAEAIPLGALIFIGILRVESHDTAIETSFDTFHVRVVVYILFD